MTPLPRGTSSGTVLVGEGFADHTVARLARLTTLSWVSDLASDTERDELAESLTPGGEEV